MALEFKGSPTEQVGGPFLCREGLISRGDSRSSPSSIKPDYPDYDTICQNTHRIYAGC